MTSNNDLTATGHRERVETCGEDVETCRDQLQDAIDRRNFAIVDAMEQHAGTLKQVAGWAQLSKAMAVRIMSKI